MAQGRRDRETGRQSDGAIRAVSPGRSVVASSRRRVAPSLCPLFVRSQGRRVPASSRRRVAPSLCPLFVRSQGRPVAASPRRLVFLSLILAAVLAPSALASDVGDFLGRRVTKVEVVIDGAPNASVNEMRTFLDVAAGQDYSPVRIHDSILRLYRSGLISGAKVEGVIDGANGVALRFLVKPQARIDSVVFEGTPVFPAAELRARLNQLDAGERLSAGAVARGLGDLTAFYSARGYYQAKIAYDIRLDPTSTRASVVYNITPGEQARVSTYN